MISVWHLLSPLAARSATDGRGFEWVTINSNNSTKSCLTDPGNGTTNGAALSMTSCGSLSDQKFSYNGAFLMINNLCVNNPSSGKLDLATCSGGSSEPWEVNPSGTIDGMQTSTKCFRASGSKVSVGSCSGTAAKWSYSGT